MHTVSLPHTLQAGAIYLRNGGAHSASAVQSFSTQSSTGTGTFRVRSPFRCYSGLHAVRCRGSAQGLAESLLHFSAKQRSAVCKDYLPVQHVSRVRTAMPIGAVVWPLLYDCAWERSCMAGAGTPGRDVSVPQPQKRVRVYMPSTGNLSPRPDPRRSVCRSRSQHSRAARTLSLGNPASASRRGPRPGACKQ